MPAEDLTALCVKMTGICQQKKKRDQNAFPFPLLVHRRFAIIRAWESIVAQKQAQPWSDFFFLALKEPGGRRWHLFPFVPCLAYLADSRERMRICKKAWDAAIIAWVDFGEFLKGTCSSSLWHNQWDLPVGLMPTENGRGHATLPVYCFWRVICRQ